MLKAISRFLIEFQHLLWCVTKNHNSFEGEKLRDRVGGSGTELGIPAKRVLHQPRQGRSVQTENRTIRKVLNGFYAGPGDHFICKNESNAY